MIPYADFLSFGVLLYVVVPALAIAFAGRGMRAWILIATAAMLLVQYGGGGGAAWSEIWVVAAYALFEWLLAATFLRLRARTERRWPFRLTLLLAALPLIGAKYGPLPASDLLGFLGISYVTLRALDVVFCIQDRLITALPPARYAAYVFFFATVSSGPIDRYRRFEKDWMHRRTRAEVLADLDGAVERLFRGLLYKFILAALVQRYWLEPAARSEGVLGTIAYMYAYSLYLFFDFAGYCAFAIAVSYVFGIHTPENFDRPFLARNIRDFWNRWHITLSWWLRDHVYMRFVMAATRGGWFANKYVASAAGLFLAFGLMGLWHGPELHYLLYGLYHGALLAAHESFTRWNKRRELWGSGRLWDAAAVLGTFHCVCFGFLLFSGHLTRGPTTPTVTYEGRLDTVGCAEIAGWVWDPARPDAPLDLDILADGRRLATIRAELPRPDLAAAGKGAGAHGFVFVPPRAVRDGWPHRIEVRLAGTTVALEPAPAPLVCGLSVVALDGFEGAHEYSDCDTVRGWAWDATRPDQPIAVDVYDGSTLIGSIVAADPQDRLRARGYGDGRHAFTFALPASIRDGTAHSLSVRIGGSDVPLRDSPQVVVCSTTPDLTPRPTPTIPPPPVAPIVAQHRDAKLTYDDNRDGTITARESGLMWEKKVGLDDKPDAANPHDADNCYPWVGKCAGGGGECRTDADCGDGGSCRADDCQSPASQGKTVFQWLAELNAARFAGHDDWRLPSSDELYSLVNPVEHGNPAANRAFKSPACGATCTDLADPACSCDQMGVYWASSNEAKPDKSWMMYFYCNGHLFLDLESNKFFARAVRGAADPE